MAKKKTTLETLAAQLARVDGRLEKMDARIERGFESADTKFAAMADDIADIRRDMATKDQLIALHGQVNAIEADLRTTTQQKLVTRIADLEEEFFGKPRG